MVWPKWTIFGPNGQLKKKLQPTIDQKFDFCSFGGKNSIENDKENCAKLRREKRLVWDPNHPGLLRSWCSNLNPSRTLMSNLALPGGPKQHPRRKRAVGQKTSAGGELWQSETRFEHSRSKWILHCCTFMNEVFLKFWSRNLGTKWRHFHVICKQSAFKDQPQRRTWLRMRVSSLRRRVTVWEGNLRGGYLYCFMGKTDSTKPDTSGVLKIPDSIRHLN